MTQADVVTETYKEVTDLKNTLTNVFSDSLVKIMEWAEITVEELAEQSRLSTKTIQRLRTNNNYNIGIRSVVAICIAMHLHPILSQHLLDAAGITFRYVVEEQMMFHFFITGFYTHSIDECNAMLQAKGFKPLSGEE